MRQFQLKAIFRAFALFVAASNPAPSISSHLAAQTAPQSPSASTATQPAPPSNPAPLAKPEQITVTAYRAPLGTLESPVTTRLLTTESLRSTWPHLRRSTPPASASSFFAAVPARSSPIPPPRAISLRALGSTSQPYVIRHRRRCPAQRSARRGWIHWQEQPELSIQSVELVRGGASDLYGLSAIAAWSTLFRHGPGFPRPAVRGTSTGEAYL